MNNEFFSIIIPAFNEEKNVKITHEAISKVMHKINMPYEIIFINDGSSDNTLKLLKEIAFRDKCVKYICLTRNFGQQASITAGMNYAIGGAIITLDCDLQDPPELIEKMIEKWRLGYKIVYAKRSERHDRFFKKYTAKIYYSLLDALSNTKIPKEVGDFRLIDRTVLEVLKNMPEKSRYLRGMVAWTGFKPCFIEYKRFERKFGQTGFTLKKMTRLAMDGLFNFSNFPLTLPLYLGMFSLIFSIISLIFLEINPSYPESYIFILLLAFSSLQFFVLWIIGEYTSRIYDETKNRPIYVIEESSIRQETPSKKA